MDTWERKIPICTKRLPFASGRELTVPVRFILSTLTESPRWKSEALCSFFGFAGSIREEFCVFASCLRMRSRSFSISAADTFSLPNLRKFFIVSSAKSFASLTIALAFSLASRRILSRCASSLSCLIFISDFMRSISRR